MPSPLRIPMPRPRRAATLALGLALAAAAAPHARAAEAAPALAPRTADTVLVKFSADATRADRADAADVLDATSSTPLLAGWRAYALDTATSLAGARADLSGVDGVERVVLDAQASVTAAPVNDPYFPYQWNLGSTDTGGVNWAAARAALPARQPVIVAVIDTGIDTAVPDLAGRLWTNPGEIAGNGVDDDGNGYVDDVNGYDFANRDGGVTDGTTDHGTHVASTIAATADNTQGIAGIADNAQILSGKFINSSSGSFSDAVLAVAYARRMGAKVFNMSIGGSYYAPMCDAIAQLVAEGRIVVVAAGNENANTDVAPRSPASCPAADLVTVASTGATGARSGFSNFGAASVDLGAPGESIPAIVQGGRVSLMSGTSMATPHVTAAAALALGAYPTLTPAGFRAAVMAGGVASPTLAGVTVSGRRLDLAGLASLLATGVPAPAPAPAPAPVPADTTPPSTPVLGAPADGAWADTPSFTWRAATDAGSGIAGYDLLVDGRVVASTTGALQASPRAALTAGRHTWQVAARDGAGNRSVSLARTIWITHSAPILVGVKGPANGATLADGRLTVSWQAAQGAGVAGYVLVIDGQTAVSMGPGARGVSGVLKRGAHTWSLRVTDLAGHVSTSPTSRVVSMAPAPATAAAKAKARSAKSLGALVLR